MQVGLQIGAFLSRLSIGKGERKKVRGLDNYCDLSSKTWTGLCSFCLVVEVEFVFEFQW